MTVGRLLAALAAGLLLGTLPLWHYAPLAVSSAPHADHEPRHGGVLGMAGDHHVEFVRGAGRVEIHLSDAWRRPVRARAGTVAFDGTREASLAWEGDRLVGADAAGARSVDVVAILADGARLAIGFELAQSGSRSR